MHGLFYLTQSTSGNRLIVFGRTDYSQRRKEDSYLVQAATKTEIQKNIYWLYYGGREYQNL